MNAMVQTIGLRFPAPQRQDTRPERAQNAAARQILHPAEEFLLKNSGSRPQRLKASLKRRWLRHA
jgi:hypothetical protein